MQSLKTKPWQANIITLYPDMFPGYLNHSILGKGLKKQIWSLKTYNPRDFAFDKHKTVDGTPAGGGAGMVMRPDIINEAITKSIQEMSEGTSLPLIYLSPKGELFNQKTAQGLAEGPGIAIICGRFEGIDERVIEKHQIKELSLGDFILTGGEIAAQVLIDATVRLIPQIVGNKESILEESFSNGLLEYPHYTRPKYWKGNVIPQVLLSGNHGKIDEWRKKKAEEITRKRRPDLWEVYKKNGLVTDSDV